MSRNEIFVKLKTILQAMGNLEAEKIDEATEETDLRTGLGLTSIGMLYTVIAIEESFAIRFEDIDFGAFRTVRDVVDYIEKKVN